MLPGILISIEKEKAIDKRVMAFSIYEHFLLIFIFMDDNEKAAIKISLASMYGAFGESQSKGRLLRKAVINSFYTPYAASSFMFLKKKPYIKEIVFDKEPQKLDIELKPLKLIEDDKQDKRYNNTSTGIYRQDIRDRSTRGDTEIS